MSWQCPNCETVNQDVAPVCTVCDHLAPVIESFLSLEGIKLQTDYNHKLEDVHAREAKGDYNGMLEAALSAMAIYKGNGLAVKKAEIALQKIFEERVLDQVYSLLLDAHKKDDINLASDLITIYDSLNLKDARVDDIKSDIRIRVSREKEIDRILEDSFKHLISLQTDEALKIVEEGLQKYVASKRLQLRRDEIKGYIASINEKKMEGELRRKHFPKPPHRRGTLESETTSVEKAHQNPVDPKRKFPKVKRRTT